MVGHFFLILVQITQIRQIVFLKTTQQFLEVHYILQLIRTTLNLPVLFFIKTMLILVVAQ
jgi:hypothetical protein